MIPVPPSLSRILIVEDETSVRKLLARYLENSIPGIRILEAANGKEGLQIYMAQKPTLILTDIMLPLMNGAALVEAIRAQNKTIPIVVFSAVMMDNTQERLGDLDNIHYIDKFCNPEILARTVADLLAGGQTFPTKSLPGRAKNKEAGARLTPRERTILSCIAGGQSTKEISQLLGIAAQTVETHRKNMHRKLGIHNTAELICKALEMNLIPAGKRVA